MHLRVVQVSLLLTCIRSLLLLLLSLLGLKVDMVPVSVLILEENMARCFPHQVWTRAVVVQPVVVVCDWVVEELYGSIWLLLNHWISHLFLWDATSEDILLVWSWGGLFKACSWDEARVEALAICSSLLMALVVVLGLAKWLHSRKILKWCCLAPIPFLIII